MIKKDICVIIPIYKTDLNDLEIQSVRQCVEILSDYSIYFIGPKNLNVDFHKNKFPEIKNFIFFEENYFKGIAGYNKLMLSFDFYKAFKKHKFMLIYQTDCYVFKDELLVWAEKNFDYIGGVWYDNYLGNPYLGAQLWHPGNGGLSLRKIKPIVELLASKKRLKNWNQLLNEKKKLKELSIFSFLKSLFLLPMNLIGYKNNCSYHAMTYNLNEDNYFMELSLRYNKLKTPSVEEALGFSWDREPEFLLNILKRLPFACHAWFRNDTHYKGNKEFWFKHIKK
ncbi:DUF5672 family protein [Lutibacter sp.]|uniref:DUF5672 family protein n=1 Tax=Lutibacter sp. TaxID=1925666 RepID=UPI002732BFAB|nr:DUF5672 family protein [Lutibacter sp.]MDP3312576.1 DUF5672 family protein [Lutibacter sp.]